MKPRKDGSTLYDHLRQVEKATGKWPQEYALPEPPDAGLFVWDVFWEIRRGVRNGFGGAEAIGFMDIDAWQRVRAFRLGNQIVDMILAMDAAYMTEWHRSEAKTRNGR